MESIVTSAAKDWVLKEDSSFERSGAFQGRRRMRGHVDPLQLSYGDACVDLSALQVRVS